MPSLVSVLVLGFFLGMRHATDPDHVIAVTTIVSRQRSVWHGAWTGVLWGVGHTLTIVVVTWNSEGEIVACLEALGPPRPEWRVRVVDNEDNVGEDRRTLALHHDPDLLPGFPIEIGSDGVSSPLTADLDGDGNEEIILSTSDGRVHAFRSDGSQPPGWPVHTDPLELQLGAPAFSTGAIATPVRGAVLGSVAVGDLDGDGQPWVVTTDVQGKAYAWDRHGVLRDVAVGHVRTPSDPRRRDERVA